MSRLVIHNYWPARALDAWNESEHPRAENGEFGEGGGARPGGADAHEWHNEKGERKLPETKGRSSVFESPIPIAKANIYAAKNYKYNDAVERAPIQDVPLHSLVTAQGVVYTEKLKPWDPDNADPIQVAIYQGQHIITQGNHRTAAAWAAGATSLKARVVNLDDPKNQHMLNPKFRTKK